MDIRVQGVAHFAVLLRRPLYLVLNAQAASLSISSLKVIAASYGGSGRLLVSPNEYLNLWAK